MPYTDAKVVTALCKVGPVKYSLKGGNGMSDYWLLENSVPNTVNFCDKEVALILALPLLRSIFH